MGKKYEKLTIKVSPQTAYHLDQISRAEQCSIGRVIDKLVRDRMLAGRYKPRKKSDEAVAKATVERLLNNDDYLVEVKQIYTDGCKEILHIEASRRCL